MGTFAVVADLEDRLGTSFDDAAYTVAESVLAGATATIKAYTRQQIEKVVGDVVTLRGNWSNRLQLPQRPVVAINSIVIKNGSVFVDELPLQFQTDYRWDSLGLVRRVSYVTGRLLAPASGFWGGDMAVVEVSYDHGYDVIPDVVREVCIGLALRRMSNQDGAQQEQIGQYSVTYEQAATALNDDDKAGLENYRATRRRVGTLQT